MIIGTAHTHGAGYALNDDRASGGAKSEYDALVCMHCQKLLNAQKHREDGGFCSRCMAPICGACADRMLTQGCEPFIKFIEQAADRAYRLRQFRKLAGLEE